MITMRQLAKRCGVSHVTVYKVLRGRGQISENTRNMVLAAVRRHNYLPNQAFAEVISRKSRMVGFVAPAASGEWCMEVILAVSRRLDAIGMKQFSMFVEDERQFCDALDEFARRRAAAVVFIPPATPPVIPGSVSGNVRLLTLAHDYGDGTPHIMADRSAVTRQAMEHLRSLGHRRIALYTYANPAITVHRLREMDYTAIMRRWRLEPVVAYGRFDNPPAFTPPEEESLVDVVRRHAPTAILGMNDEMTLKALRILAKNSIRAPDDLSVMACNATARFRATFPEVCTLADPTDAIADSIITWIHTGKTRPVAGPLALHEGTTARKIDVQEN